MGSMLNLGSWKKRKSAGVGGGGAEFRSPSRGRAKEGKTFRRTQSEATRPAAFTLPHPHPYGHPPPPGPGHLPHQTASFAGHSAAGPAPYHAATLGRPVAPAGPPPHGAYSTATLPNPRTTHHHNGYLGRSAVAGSGGAGGYYYSGRNATTAQAPQPRPIHHSRERRGGREEMETPSYWVEHLATFAVGPQYGLNTAQDGIRKLKQMERSSAIWAQPMVLRLRPQQISVEDENGELVESFPMALVQDPTAHLSNNPDDTYNNILLFVVGEDRSTRSGNPTEMHIFQCSRVSANDVVADISAYIGRDYKRVPPGRRNTNFAPGADLGLGNGFQSPFGSSPSPAGPGPVSYTRTESREIRPSSSGVAGRQRPGGVGLRDDASGSSDSSEYFERDVNTLNRCFDDIERFVSRIQSAALAQREMEAAQARKHKGGRHKDPGILALRAQLPGELEFLDVLQKFKLSFNLLAKLRNHIHEPNAPELLHFLFTPLTVILDACHWGLGRNIAPQVLSPLLTREAIDLLRNCLTSKESDVWLALGQAWRTSPEEWPDALPPPYRPVFADGYMPYGPPGPYQSEAPPSVAGHPPPGGPPHRSASGLHHARSTDNLNLDLDRISLEKDKLEFEREKVAEEKRRIAERERKVWEEERRLEEEKMAVAAARERLHEDQRSVISSTPGHLLMEHSAQSSPSLARGPPPATSTPNGLHSGQSPRQRCYENGKVDPGTLPGPFRRAFLEELRAGGSKVAVVTYDRVGQNSKELTVSKGEYLEVVNDRKKWWECRNVLGRAGYVPHTILNIFADSSTSQRPTPPSAAAQQPLFVQAGASNGGPPYAHHEQNGGNGVEGGLSPGSRPGNMLVMDDATPEYIKRRQGKRGEFRYF